jgi:hemolysin activation/secretion protein
MKKPGLVCLSVLALMTSGLHTSISFAQAPTEASSKPQKFPVKAVRVDGNTLLTEGAISALIAPLPGEDRTISDLRQAAARVQDAYRDAGYGGVVAFIPEQAIADGKVIIEVIEGKLAKVKVSGNEHFEDANVRVSLPNLLEGTTPLVRLIDQNIQLSNENPAKEIKVTLTAGTKPGEIDADIVVADRKPSQVLFNLNNAGNKSTGYSRVSVGYQHANLSGRDDVVTLQYQTSPEHLDQVHLYSLGYRLPLYGKSSSIDAFYAYSNVDNGTTATQAGPLTFTGKGAVMGLRGNYYLDRIGEYDQRVTMGLDWRDYNNDCSIGTLGAVACGTAGASIQVLPLTISYTGQKQGPWSSWGVNGSVSANVGGSSRGEFEAARAGAMKNYVIARFSGFANWTLSNDFSIQTRLEGQYSPYALVSGEMFGIGGASYLRGYLEREMVGDYGIAGSVTAYGPDLGKYMAQGQVTLRPLVFVDVGRVGNHQGLPCRGVNESPCNLSSFGLGLRSGIGKKMSTSLDIGRALRPGITTAKGDYRAHVSISFSY